MTDNSATQITANGSLDPFQTAQSSIDRVAVRIPPFLPADPEMWFHMAERSLDASGVSNAVTKVSYILGALEPKYATEVRDIIIAPPSATQYDDLKAALISRLSSSQEQKTRQLLEREEMGDRKPSQFLRHLRGLAGTTVSDSVLRSLWASRLPAAMQMVLATQRDVGVDKVADLADAIAEATPVRLHVVETTNHNVEGLINLRVQQRTRHCARRWRRFARRSLP